MTKKQFAFIFVVCISLFVVFLVLDRKDNQVKVSDKTKIVFGDLNSEKIAKVSLGSNEGSIVLQYENDLWGVASRDSYPADVNHVRSLLLKILDLSVSQKITSNTKRFEALGVADKNFVNQLTFFDAQGTPLGGLLLGNTKEREVEEGSSLPVGQYIRRVGENDVYLSSQVISLEKDVFYWLDANISNFLSSKVSSISQFKLSEGREALDFELKVQNESFVVVGDEKEPDGSAVSKISTALENSRLKDVYKSGDERVKDLVFDTKTVYKGLNGLVYTVFSTEKDSRYFAKFQVEFREDLVKKMQEQEESKTDQETEVSKSPQLSISTPVPTPEKKTYEVSSPEEAETLNSRYSSWIYELPEYQGKKFRIRLSDLFPKEDEEVE